MPPTPETQGEPETVVAKDSLGNALIYVTTVVLLLAFFVMESALAKKFNAGMFRDETKPIGGELKP